MFSCFRNQSVGWSSIKSFFWDPEKLRLPLHLFLCWITRGLQTAFSHRTTNLWWLISTVNVAWLVLFKLSVSGFGNFGDCVVYSLFKEGLAGVGCPGLSPVGFENLHWWRLHSLSGQWHYLVTLTVYCFFLCLNRISCISFGVCHILSHHWASLRLKAWVLLL